MQFNFLIKIFKQNDCSSSMKQRIGFLDIIKSVDTISEMTDNFCLVGSPNCKNVFR